MTRSGSSSFKTMAKKTSFWWSTICRKTTVTTGTTGTRVPTPRKMTRKMICRESDLLELEVHISVDRALPAGALRLRWSLKV
jgi:hypothetical protein